MKNKSKAMKTKMCVYLLKVHQLEKNYLDLQAFFGILHNQDHLGIQGQQVNRITRKV